MIKRLTGLICTLLLLLAASASAERTVTIEDIMNALIYNCNLDMVKII